VYKEENTKLNIYVRNYTRRIRISKDKFHLITSLLYPVNLIENLVLSIL
jgi:hypothetical protein